MNKNHLLTIAVEDYYQATAVGRLIPNNYWSRFDSRIEHTTHLVLDFLDEYEIKATFFVLGWIADAIPEILQEIFSRGHEVASRGYYHQPLHNMLREEFYDDIVKSKEAIENAINHRVLGFRISQGHFSLKELWALDILREVGYFYDSSIYPRFRSIAAEPWRRFPHVVHTHFGDIHEFPLSSIGTDSFLFPAAGGNYFRQMPRLFAQLVFRQWITTYQSPFNMYFHIWEIDPQLPKITAGGFITKLRMYRNVSKIRQTYEQLFQKYSFQGIANYLGLEQDSLDAQHNQIRKKKNDIIRIIPNEQNEGRANFIQNLSSAPVSNQKKNVTIIIPCYNEELALPYLANTLNEVEQQLSSLYNIYFLFIDDGSTDNTWISLNYLFGDKRKFSMLRHSANRGVAAAILTGIRHSKTEIVCSIDCDCTYDPHQLHSLVPMLNEDIAMVTASPYHPFGKVLNVPRWRLFLSRCLSFIYRQILNNKLATYTSCFRAYHRSKVKDIELSNQNFLGVLEILALLDLRGEKIIECPAILQVRIFGVSKMKTIRVIIGHIGLIFKILFKKVFHKKSLLTKRGT